MSESHSPEPITFNPTPRDRVAGFIGRTLRADAVAQPAPQTVDLAHTLQTAEQDPAHTISAESSFGQAIIAGLRQTRLLEKPVFVPHELLEDSSVVASLAAAEDQPISLPARNFVSGPGLEDWAGTNRQREAIKSSSLRRRYARQGTTAPPIGLSVAYIQPNGLALFSAVQDGAHRLAAAHVRGDSSETIDVANGLLIKRLHKDIIK